MCSYATILPVSIYCPASWETWVTGDSFTCSWDICAKQQLDQRDKNMPIGELGSTKMGAETAGSCASAKILGMLTTTKAACVCFVILDTVIRGDDVFIGLVPTKKRCV